MFPQRGRLALLSPSSRDRFWSDTIRGVALLLAAVVVETAFPLSLAAYGVGSSSNSTAAVAGCSPSAYCALLTGLEILWNGIFVVLVLLAISAFLAARSVLRLVPPPPPSAMVVRTVGNRRGGDSY